MKQSSEPVLVVAALIQRDFDPEKKILIVRRGPGQSGAGFWEFPGGKVEIGEDPKLALVREIDEELGLKIRVGDLLGEQDFAYPSKVIRLRVYWVLSSHDDLELREHDALKWCSPHEIVVEELSAADRPFVELIKLR
ncbi:(deoxy)nucleoside triphosphate pyrophosphohydrolase [Bdellovibrio svalbardensis]|uniref:8-oxo-dGTP diphosphatase n=1 Tax=Bdellovibrio svalbardensis TaxID=2972972 RepID=A0ABT6DMI1_9BACT|nr:(deoxy)nucleoside triphosphate pyrophosphohydrolase [Bdellovibrio svalbardensis]MDG0816348.1 (deoxy)nucleoside triphosphate pyrophosphohydrolase [Bdellovibrio svalbardensis]